VEPDLHCDAEDPWPDGLGEPGGFRVHGACEQCGCAGTASVVRFVPVHADGSGVLTTEEIADVLGQARLRVLEMWERTQARGLEPMSGGSLPEDVVMRIDGHADGSFRAVIIATGGNIGQSYVRYGRGSTYAGAPGWRQGLSTSRLTHQVTTEEERADGLIAYEGAPGILNFARRPPYTPMEEEAREAFQARRAVRDRTSRTTAWDRHIKPEREPSQLPGMSPGIPGSWDELRRQAEAEEAE
jgi:hypothetical protein